MPKAAPRTLSKLQVSLLGLGWVGALALLGLAHPASAQTQTQTEFSANAGVATDYVFRGVSQTLNDPAIQAGVDLTHGQFYAGAWASNVDFGDGQTDAEIDLYAGIRPRFGGLNWDVGVVGYLYTDTPDGADYNYAELKVAAAYELDRGQIGAAVFYSPDYFGALEDEATYAEINGSFDAHDRVTVSGALGRQFLSSDLDHTTWNIGAAWQASEHLALDLRYHDTSRHELGKTYDSRIILSLKAVL